MTNNQKYASGVRYPIFKVAGRPTPNDKLVVCIKCGRAAWTTHSDQYRDYCCAARMREATAVEYKVGYEKLQVVI